MDARCSQAARNPLSGRTGMVLQPPERPLSGEGSGRSLQARRRMGVEGPGRTCLEDQMSRGRDCGRRELDEGRRADAHEGAGLRAGLAVVLRRRLGLVVAAAVIRGRVSRRGCLHGHAHDHGALAVMRAGRRSCGRCRRREEEAQDGQQGEQKSHQRQV